jgi:hypothetical protein
MDPASGRQPARRSGWSWRAEETVEVDTMRDRQGDEAHEHGGMPLRRNADHRKGSDGVAAHAAAARRRMVTGTGGLGGVLLPVIIHGCMTVAFRHSGERAGGMLVVAVTVCTVFVVTAALGHLERLDSSVPVRRHGCHRAAPGQREQRQRERQQQGGDALLGL